jgi:hypothetical protein
MPFGDPPVGGNTLIRPAIHSPNYVAGVSGWSINRDGSAEFNNATFRGNVIVKSGNSQIFVTTVSGNPTAQFNPDTTLYDAGFIRAIVTGGLPTLEMFSPATNTGFFAGVTLVGGATVNDTRAFVTAASVESTGYLIDGAATSSFQTSNSAAVTPGNNLDVATLNITSPRNDTILKICGQWHGVGFVTPVAYPGNVLTMRLTRDGAQIASCRILGQNTALTQMGGNLAIPDTPAAGNHTYALSILHEASSTAASVHTVATGNSPTTLTVEGWGN